MPCIYDSLLPSTFLVALIWNGTAGCHNYLITDKPEKTISVTSFVKNLIGNAGIPAWRQLECTCVPRPFLLMCRVWFWDYCSTCPWLSNPVPNNSPWLPSPHAITTCPPLPPTPHSFQEGEMATVSDTKSPSPSQPTAAKPKEGTKYFVCVQ